jgi:hypothetical protein
LHLLAVDCALAAEELNGHLGKLTVDNPTGWQSFQIAFKTMWKKGKIEMLSKRLNSYRKEIALRLLVLLNAKTETLVSREKNTVKQARNESADIVEVLSINHETLRTALKSQTEEIMLQNEANTQKWHRETLGAILTLRDGSLQTVLQADDESNEHRYDNIDRFGTGCTLTFRMESAGDTSGPESLVAKCDTEATASRVLGCLNFRKMTDRFDEVPSAHNETFGWVFRDPAESDKPWGNFTEWLECGSGCYWICGKAGSGKSTLMKYIHENEATYVALKRWAGTATLVTASFFFWNIGSPLQKSQPGLIRSLFSAPKRPAGGRKGVDTAKLGNCLPGSRDR